MLIPGAGHGGWAWLPVAGRLRAAGHRAFPATLPETGACERRTGYGLGDAGRHVVAEVDGHGLGAVVLAAHSLGGATLATTAAVLRERVAEMVFVSAYVPLPGESFADANRTVPGTGQDHVAPASFEAFRAVLMQDQPSPPSASCTTC